MPARKWTDVVYVGVVWGSSNQCFWLSHRQKCYCLIISSFFVRLTSLLLSLRIFLSSVLMSWSAVVLSHTFFVWSQVFFWSFLSLIILSFLMCISVAISFLILVMVCTMFCCIGVKFGILGLGCLASQFLSLTFLFLPARFLFGWCKRLCLDFHTLLFLWRICIGLCCCFVFCRCWRLC